MTRVVFDGRRAVAVDIERRGGGTERIEGGEVILAGGAINSPQLLQLSGVGRAEDLEALGIDVVADLPGVGDHLQDHLEVYIQYKSLQPVSMQPTATQLWRRPFIGAQWLFLRSGPGATNHFEGGGFARSNDDVLYPNLMFHFLPLAIRYDGSAGAAGHGYQVHVGPMYSDARGSVSLKTSDPHDHPALRFNYLSTDQDRREWVEAIRVARHILNQPAMDPFNGGETSPGVAVTTDDEIRAWVARDAETALHPSCTARMGVDDASVLDPLTMRVHGLDGLRVVDASSMPYVTNANIYAPVMMLAEKSADLILGNTPLPPEDTQFYRHVPAGETAVTVVRRGGGRQRGGHIADLPGRRRRHRAWLRRRYWSAPRPIATASTCERVQVALKADLERSGPTATDGSGCRPQHGVVDEPGDDSGAFASETRRYRGMASGARWARVRPPAEVEPGVATSGPSIHPRAARRLGRIWRPSHLVPEVRARDQRRARTDTRPRRGRDEDPAAATEVESPPPNSASPRAAASSSGPGCCRRHDRRAVTERPRPAHHGTGGERGSGQRSGDQLETRHSDAPRRWRSG